MHIKKYMSVRNADLFTLGYLKQSYTGNNLNQLINISHIHGTNDGIFPSKHIQNYIASVLKMVHML